MISTQVILPQTHSFCTSNSRRKTPLIKGMGFHAFLEEIWEAILGFVEARDYSNLALVSRDIKRISTKALSNKLLETVFRKITLSLLVRTQVISRLSLKLRC